MFAEVAHAATYASVIGKVQTTITGSIVPLVSGAAVIFFLWGLVRYLKAADSEAERATGRKFMLWGLLGLLVLVGTWGFVGLFTQLLGIDVHIPQF